MQGQAGVTLVEILLALVLTMVIVGPLTAWSVLVLSQRDDSENELGRINATGLINQYLPRDVGSAKYVSSSGGQCVGVTGSNTPKLQLKPTDQTRRIVYDEATASDPEGTVTTSLWRHVCDSKGDLADSTELVRGIRAGSVTVRCWGPSGEAPASPDGCDTFPGSPTSNDANSQVDLTVVPLDAEGRDARPMEFRVTRRTSASSTGSPATSNRNPNANIAVSPVSGYTSTAFTLSAARSSDSDGSVVSYDWTIPGPHTCTGPSTDATQHCTFSTTGSKTIQLVVTDNGGASNATTATLDVINQFPTAQASVSPAAGTAGTTAFTFSAVAADGTATTDPDGDALSYRWDLGEDMGISRYQSGPNVTFTFPADTPAGVRQVTLLVTDSNGANDFAVVQIDLAAVGTTPGGGGGTELNGIDFDPGLVTSGTGLPRIPDPVGAGLPARAVTFSSADPAPDPATVAWQLVRHGTSTIVDSGSGATMSHSFGPGDGGEYDIVRYVTGVATPTTVAFRVNAAPISSFTATPGSGTAPLDITFDSSGASDADGGALSYHWYFGFFDQWSSSNPNPVWSFPNAGTYSVALIVTDSDGASTTFTRTITLGGSTTAPTGVRWDGWNIDWNAVPGATSYDVRVNYLCGPDSSNPTSTRTNPYTVAPALAPTVSTPSVVTVCGDVGTANVVVSTTANAVTSPFSAPVTHF
jgi:PKD repeat protein